MTLYVLDTDHLSLFQKAHPRIVRRVAALEPETLAVTIITAEEQLRGWFRAIRQAPSGNRLTWAYAGLHAALDYFCRIRLLDFDQLANAHYETLRRQKIRIGTQDLRIAAIVWAAGGILVTRNRRDFSQVPGLEIKDWTV